MKKLKAALIGCGTISGCHGNGYVALRDSVELVYCCDLIPERAEDRKARFGSPETKCITDYRIAVADPEIDIVSVCLPNYLHAPVSIEFLNAGKHVLCEKPAAMNYAEALAMKEAADRNGKILNIGVVNRFNAAVSRLHDLVASGELGEIYQIYCSFRAFRSIPGMGGWFTTKALSGGGALIDWGVHFLDLINYVVGEQQVKTVSAEAHAKLGADMRGYVYRSMHAGPPKYDGVCDVEEYVTGLIRTTGPTLTFSGAWAQNIDEEAMFIDFLGTKGGVKLPYRGKYTVYSTKNGELDSETPDYPMPDDYVDELIAFADSARTGIKNRANIDRILITAQMMDGIYASAAKHAEIAY